MSTIQTPEQFADWKHVWRIALEGLSGEKIKTALDACIKNHDWPPSPAEFRALCIPQLDYEKMFIDAANALSTGRWPDQLTYWAANSIGSFDMRRLSYDQLKARWIKTVDLMAESSSLPPIPEQKPALPAPGQTVSPEVAEGAIKAMRECLKGMIVENGKLKGES